MSVAACTGPPAIDGFAFFHPMTSNFYVVGCGPASFLFQNTCGSALESSSTAASSELFIDCGSFCLDV